MHLLVLAMWSLVLMVVALFIGVALGIPDAPSLTPNSALRPPNSELSLLLLWNTLVQLLTFALPVFLVSRRYYRDTPLFAPHSPSRTPHSSFLIPHSSFRSFLLPLLVGIAVLLLLVPITDWLTTWNDSWHFSGAWEKLERGLRAAGEQSQQIVDVFMKECHPLLNLFCLALIPALCEELFFRAGIQNLLYKSFARSKLSILNSQFSIHAAVWITAALFSLAHGEVFAFLPRLLLGALLGYLYVYGRSLLVNVAAHFVNNAIIVVAYAINSPSFDPSQPIAASVPVTVACTAAALALFWFVFLRRPSRKQ